METMGSFCNEAVAPFAAMVAVESSLMGIFRLSKAAMSGGGRCYAYLVYYYALAALILLPSFIFQRRRPILTFGLISKFILLGLIGSSGVMFGSSALSNLVPAFTFILASIFSMEKFDIIRSRDSQAKTFGTIVSITGAIIVTLYNGQPILIAQSHSSVHQLVLLSPKSIWVIGGLFLAVGWLLMFTCNITLGSAMKEYLAELTIAFFYCFFVTIHSTLFTLIAEKDLSVGRLMPDIELIVVVYSAIAGSALSTIICTWSLHNKGPINMSIFKPFGIVIAVIAGVIFLWDTNYIGSVIESFIISVGFYGMIWRKSKEEKMIEDVNKYSLESYPHVFFLGSNDNDNNLVLKED